ncbi:histidine--tRNA ligase [Bogoriella caseilytica]|uniref:Histidine--tRNA ligase n=1 Tax=Bogoriella caseilytica TaxID=56055 RepID=A0A3N2BGX4_9MICO|nr:histidine--tRNA ligase [Bogoriella caseilytica]ROR74334.1 histidyl-tRNA synthetase [Bogoriella caseilytica]
MARTSLSGFPELLPETRMVEQRAIDSLRRSFELHGFAGIETRAVEPLDQLLRKGETSKEVYLLRRLHEESVEGHSGIGLHFDLTVPFARYVLENAGKLSFPFRRYQIQKAWRGERPQEGRYREFTQADIDIVGRDALPFHHDVEVTRVMAQAMARLADPALLGLPGFRIQVNNRKLIQGFYAGLGVPDPEEAMRIVDKLDKLPAEKVGELLTELEGIDAAMADRILELAGIRSAEPAEVARAVRDLGVTHELLDTGLEELLALLSACADLHDEHVSIEADLSIARGLDYYTGTVFETRMTGYESLGSICSGGRYDALATDGKTTYPGVGISLGLSRVIVPVIARTGLRASRPVPSAVLVAVADEESRAASEAVAAALRTRDIPCEVAPTAAKFGKQIRYADRRGIPFVWFSGDEGDQVKDIRSGEQVAAEAATWAPPRDDLVPQVVSEP